MKGPPTVATLRYVMTPTVRSIFPRNVYSDLGEWMTLYGDNFRPGIEYAAHVGPLTSLPCAAKSESALRCWIQEVLSLGIASKLGDVVPAPIKVGLVNADFIDPKLEQSVANRPQSALDVASVPTAGFVDLIVQGVPASEYICDFGEVRLARDPYRSNATHTVCQSLPLPRAAARLIVPTPPALRLIDVSATEGRAEVTLPLGTAFVPALDAMEVWPVTVPLLGGEGAAFTVVFAHPPSGQMACRLFPGGRPGLAMNLSPNQVGEMK